VEVPVCCFKPRRRTKIRSFAEEEIKPLAFLMDQNNEFPEEAVKKLWKLGRKGFEFGDHYDKMGIRSSSTAELIFNDVKVPKENLLGK